MAGDRHSQIKRWCSHVCGYSTQSAKLQRAGTGDRLPGAIGRISDPRIPLTKHNKGPADDFTGTVRVEPQGR